MNRFMGAIQIVGSVALIAGANVVLVVAARASSIIGCAVIVAVMTVTDIMMMEKGDK